MNTEITMEFEFGHYNGTMNMDVYAGDELLARYQDHNIKTCTLQKNILMPCTLRFSLSNKDKFDTEVYQDKIVADKYVKLTKMLLGRIPVATHILIKICQINDQFANNYWGQNGTVTIDLNVKDFIQWHLSNKNVFDLHPGLG